ncbi:uncharacterized protein LOC130940104 [Arachis stenosperma]|uniref:uncharacterized protein LOC130940104 n=1 Tax=Arachis stenosperma TaxID=217475 RepID=UPI0025AD084C|nr:uncharacterized protein LOC130940104 [Arachis stenosperma]
MERWVLKKWARKDVVRVMDLEENFFLIRFFNQEDYSYALFEGPWMIADHYLLVQRWRPLFIPQEVDIRKVAVWIRIPNLPAELYNKYFLWKVGKALGTMLKIDELTSIHSRGKFARVCVEIDLRKPVIPIFSTLGKEFKLEYEGLYQICFKCGRYGHRLENYSEWVGDMPKQVIQTTMDGGRMSQYGEREDSTDNQTGSLEKETLNGEGAIKAINQELNDEKQVSGTKKGKNPIDNEEGKGNKLTINEENPFGPWMLVKRNPRRNKIRMEESARGINGNSYGSKFQVLSEETFDDNNESNEERAVRDANQYQNKGRVQDQGRNENNVYKYNHKLQNQKNQPKSKAFTSNMREKTQEMERKNVSNQNQYRNKPSTTHIHEKQNNQNQEKIMEHTQNKGKQKDKHHDYWRSFSLLNKELAKEHNNGGHIPISDTPNPTTMSVISRIMGGQGTREGDSNTANNLIDPGDAELKSGSKDMVIMDQNVDGEESPSSPKPMEA